MNLNSIIYLNCQLKSFQNIFSFKGSYRYNMLGSNHLRCVNVQFVQCDPSSLIKDFHFN